MPGRTPGSGVGRARSVSLWLALAVAFLGLLWLGSLYVDYREGAWMGGVFVFDEEAWAFDLRAYLGAADRIVGSGSPYSAELVGGSFEPGPADLYYYAPPLSVALIPFLDLSLADSSALWWLLRVGALAVACMLMPVPLPLRATAFAVVAFSLPALKDTVIGNVSLLLVLPMVVTWRWLDRPIGSLVMAVAISLRPSLGLYLVWQVLRRQWRGAAWTVLGGIALVALTLPFVGLGGYADYVAVLRNLALPTDGAAQNRDLGSMLVTLGLGEAGPTLGRVTCILASAIALVLSLRRDREVGYMVVLCGSLLVVPLLWDHYLATLVVPAAFLAHRMWPPLILLPLASWLPILSPLIVLLTMGLTVLIEDGSSPDARRPVSAGAWA